MVKLFWKNIASNLASLQAKFFCWRPQKKITEPQEKNLEERNESEVNKDKIILSYYQITKLLIDI